MKPTFEHKILLQQLEAISATLLDMQKSQKHMQIDISEISRTTAVNSEAIKILTKTNDEKKADIKYIISMVIVIAIAVTGWLIK